MFYLALSFLDGEGLDLFSSTLSFLDGEGIDMFYLALSFIDAILKYHLRNESDEENLSEPSSSMKESAK